MKVVEVRLFARENDGRVAPVALRGIRLDADDVSVVVRALRAESDRVMPWESKMLTLFADALEDL